MDSKRIVFITQAAKEAVERGQKLAYQPSSRSTSKEAKSSTTKKESQKTSCP